MKWQARIAMGMLIVGLVTTTGCRYGANRYYDFRDTFELGAGITAENNITGVVPPSLGLKLQLTDFLQLGWISHNGYTAELDMRGTFVGPEMSTEAGFFWWQWIHKNQMYENRYYMNRFKDKDFSWCIRMESHYMSWRGRPAKRLHYEHWAPYPIEGFGLTHKGWHYWGLTGFKVAICDPFLTHLGFMLKAGIDVSEMSDFLLGWFMIDFKHDDMTEAEYHEYRHGRTETVTDSTATATETTTPAPAPSGGEQPPTGTTPAEPMRQYETQPFPEMEIIYFDYDRHDIRPDQLPRMERNLAFLKSNPDIRVQVEGHCDERGTTEYNYNLGLRRATTVSEYLVNNGIDRSRVQMVSKGEEEPVDTGHTEEAWAKNRRSEFKRVVLIRATTQP